MTFKASKKFILSAVAVLALLFSTAATQAENIDVRFTDPVVNCTAGVPTNLCVNLQVRSAGASVELGNSTVFFSVNSNAIQNCQLTPGSDANFSIGAGYGFETAFSSQLQSNGVEEGNFNIMAANGPLPAGIVTSVGAAYIDMAEFCWDIIDDTQSADIVFIPAFSGFNNVTTNDGTDEHTPTYIDLNGVGLDASNCAAAGTVVSLTALLEGPLSGTTMGTGINAFIPNAQPYGALIPYTYGGSENLATIPADMTDWCLITAATSADGGATFTVVETRAGVMKSDGSIVDADGGSTTGVTFTGLSNGTAYYFIVRHRSHLDVVSATPVTVAANAATFDFTTADQTLGGITQQKLIGGVYVLQSGDLDGNMNINAFDYILRLRPETGFLNDYYIGDIDMNANVNAFDYILKLRPNTGNLGVSTIAW